MRLVVLLVLLGLAVGAATAQDDTTAGNSTGNDTATNETVGETPATPTPPAAADCDDRVTLVGKDDLKWYLDGGGSPNPRLSVCASKPVTFVLTTEGAQVHNFAVRRGADLAPGAPKATAAFSAGDTPVEYVWETPDGGTFTYICVIHGTAMSGAVTAGEAAAPPPTEGGDDVGPINGGSVSLKEIAPDASCDKEIPAVVSQNTVGGKTAADYASSCVAQAEGGDPEPHPVDYVIPLSFLLIGVGVVAIVWVHKSYKP